MSCECLRSIEESLVAVRSRIIGEKNRLLNQLEKFKEGIRSGFNQLVAKHLFEAGAYFASLDNDLARHPSLQQIINSLKKRLNDRSTRLLRFVETNGTLFLIQLPDF